MSVDFIAPPNAGNFCVFFRLVHGEDQIEFGDKVFIDIEVKEQAPVKDIPMFRFDNIDLPKEEEAK